MNALHSERSTQRPTDRRVGHRGRRPLAAAVVLPALMVLSACHIRTPVSQDPSVYLTLDAGGHEFHDATIFFPAEQAGPYAAVAIAPGLLVGQDSYHGWGPLLASEGYVTIIIDTNTTLDDHLDRGDQLLAALDYLTTESSVGHLVDRDRLAVMGHSMGGGGAMVAAEGRPDLAAAIPMAAHLEPIPDQSGTAVPTLYLACENDVITPNASNGWPAFVSMRDADRTSTAYVEVSQAGHGRIEGHSCPMWPTGIAPASVVQELVIGWLDHFVQGDTTVPACPPVAVGGPISRAEANCP